MTDHPITPPPELTDVWKNLPLSDEEIFVIAARWGSDQELEACMEWAAEVDRDLDKELSAARRPKPPSLKEQALAAFEHILNHSSTELGADTIRRALEALDD